MSSISTSRFEETKAQIEKLNKNKFEDIESRKLAAVEKIKTLESGKRVPIPLEFINLTKNKRLEEIKEDDHEFLQLVETIKEVGILQAPVVTVIDNEIIPLLGHRRIAAAKFLGMPTVICEIKFFAEGKQNILASLVENTARKNWDIIAVSKSLKELSEEGYNITRLAELLSKDRNTIGRLLKVAAWNIEIHELIKNYPDKLKMKLILNLASKQLTEDEVLNSLKNAAGLASLNQNLIHTRFVKNEKKVNEYIETQNFSKHESKLILDALVHFGVIKNEHAIQDRIED